MFLFQTADYSYVEQHRHLQVMVTESAVAWIHGLPFNRENLLYWSIVIYRLRRTAQSQ